MASRYEPLDWRRLRGVLAEQRISHKRFAEVARLSRCHLTEILNGYPCGELAHFKIQRALGQMGLTLEREEMTRAAS